ncbi:Uncharacterized protein GBIM_01283 [Gryllus bimaculatus]|nr:Uncharacterized protein GBIM_01283 [Gryllus bimaculatus]
MSQRSEYERERMIKIQSEQVNTRLTKLVQLRNALIAQATDLNIQIPEAEQAKTKGKEKGGKGKKGKDNKEEDVKEKARQRREELIQNLMGELNLLDVTQLALPKSGSKDGESDSKKSGGSKASKASRKSGSSKKAGPEKEFFRTLEKLKSIPLNKTCSVLFSEEEVKLPIGLEEIPDDDFEPPFEKVVEKPVITARKSTLQQISSMLKSLVEVKDEMEAEKKGEEKKSIVEEKKSVAEDRKSKKEKRPTAKSGSTAARAVSYARRSKSFEKRKSTAEMTEEEKRMFRLTSMIEFELKTDVVYFETPIVVLWDYDKQYWSYENILHLKAEEKQVTFELKKVGPLALATFRYSNIPFRSWDMRPCLEDQTVQLFMRSNHVNVTFKIKFYADLNQLMQDRMPLHLQKKVKSLSPTQIETVYEMLCLTKVISYTTTYPENPKVPFVSYQMQPPEEDVKGKGKKGKKGKEKGKKSK